MMKLVVLSCLVAAAACSGLVAPLAYSVPLAYSAPLAYSSYAPIAYSAPWGLAPSNYRGPLSLAPGQPASILGSDGRPLDTLEVNLDKVSKALNNGIHLLKKRSVAVIAPFATPFAAPIVAPTPLITPASPILNRVAPIAHVSSYPTPYASYL